MLANTIAPLLVDGIISSAYALEYSRYRSSSRSRSRKRKPTRSRYKSPIQYDKSDSAFNDDFDFLMGSYFDQILDNIGNDLRSVWSTNKSEQESQNSSA